jgi:hypothetical protein
MASQKELSPISARYADIVKAMLKYEGVKFPTDRKGFGSSALWISGKMFAFLSSQDELILKLPEDRVNTLVASGRGTRCDLGHGRPIKQWLAIKGQSNKLGLELAKESWNLSGPLLHDGLLRANAPVS